MKRTERITYPSPPFLLEPAHDGKPYPHELPMYMAYLRYQLRRGPIGILGRQKHFPVLQTSCVLVESSLAIMRFLGEHGAATTQEVVAQGFMDPELVKSRLRSLAGRKYLLYLGTARWGLAEQGREAIGGTQDERTG